MLDVVLLVLKIATLLLLFLFIFWVVRSARRDLSAGMQPGSYPYAPEHGAAPPSGFGQFGGFPDEGDRYGDAARYGDAGFGGGGLGGGGQDAGGGRYGEGASFPASSWPAASAGAGQAVRAADEPEGAHPEASWQKNWPQSPPAPEAAAGEPGASVGAGAPGAAPEISSAGLAGLQGAAERSQVSQNERSWLPGAGEAASQETRLWRPRLIVERSAVVAPGTEISVENGLSIGRSPASDLTLDDPFVSSAHARIVRRGRECFVEDLGSTNGTFLNERTVAEAPLTPDSRLRLGETVFRYAE